MKERRIYPGTIFMLALWVLLGVGCSSADDPEPVNEEELITTVNVTFTNAENSNDVIVASFQDLDGPGGNDGTTTNPTLSTNTTYNVTVEFLNESETPPENITQEVADESDDHQVFFVVNAGLNFTFTYTDQDGSGRPLGLAGTVETGNAGTGNVAVVLVHEPIKTNVGVANGDITNAGGDEDVRVNFTVTIQ